MNKQQQSARDAAREPVTHELKCWPPFFQTIRRGEKTFEIRVNDRDYRVGDALRLREYCTSHPHDSEPYYTGQELMVEVSYMAQGIFGLPDDVCVMSLQRFDEGYDAAKGESVTVKAEPHDKGCADCGYELDFSADEDLPICWRCDAQEWKRMYDKAVAAKGEQLVIQTRTDTDWPYVAKAHKPIRDGVMGVNGIAIGYPANPKKENMSRKDGIVKELEQQYGIECDANFDPSVLCGGDTCCHSECDCWGYFKGRVEKHLLLQASLRTMSDANTK